ncbi:MAG: BMP family ABC transporter substrate-binding protein [Myxococcales bacterium]|nr:BMP family ABC transporter substrate-binding protein [Myxococcales bacterium]
MQLILPGTTGDGGWNQAHDAARLLVEEELGIETDVEELVGLLDVRDSIASALDGGANVVVTASSDYIVPTLEAASNNPDSYFLSCCGSSASDNLTSFFGRIYQPLYVAGGVAAEMSCTKRLGVVAALPVPQFIRHINAFTLGARAADRAVEVEVLWLDSYFDPKREAELADALMDNGADVVLVQTNSTIAIERSAQRTVQCGGDDVPVYSVGYHDEGMCDVAPERCLTSAYWNWAPYYASRFTALQQGTWDPFDVAWQPWISGDDSVVQLLDWPLFVPGKLRNDADQLANQLQEGNPAEPFVGPVFDNLGEVRIDSGESLTDEELERLCWFVEGVVDEDGDPAVVPNSCVGDF